MTLELIFMALVFGIFAGAMIFLVFHIWQLKHLRNQQDDEQMVARMIELAEHHSPGETLAETAMRVHKQRKDQQRRARQRKAARRNK